MRRRAKDSTAQLGSRLPASIHSLTQHSLSPRQSAAECERRQYGEQRSSEYQTTCRHVSRCGRAAVDCRVVSEVGPFHTLSTLPAPVVCSIRESAVAAVADEEVVRGDSTGSAACDGREPSAAIGHLEALTHSTAVANVDVDHCVASQTQRRIARRSSANHPRDSTRTRKKSAEGKQEEKGTPERHGPHCGQVRERGGGGWASQTTIREVEDVRELRRG